MEPRLWFNITTLLAPNGMNSATITDTEFSVITSSRSSRMVVLFGSPLSCARCALLSVGRPPCRRHCGTYAEET